MAIRETAINRSFDDELLLRMGGGSQGSYSRFTGNINHGVYIDEVVTSFEQGNVNQTYKNTDVALFRTGVLYYSYR